MTTTIEGWFGFSNPLRPLSEFDVPAPFVSCSVEHQGREFPLDFLVDTGSDVTTVMPHDAYDIFGDEYFKLDFQGHPQRLSIEGVGRGEYGAIPLDAIVHLEDKLGNDVAISRRIWLAEPPREEFSDSGDWQLPSIFGRDAIRPGDFEMSYVNHTVTLIRPENE